MASRRRRFLAIAALLGLMIAAPGCQMVLNLVAIPLRLIIPDTKKYPAEYKIGSQSVLVIPFRDLRRDYFESRDGMDLAAAVMGELISRKEIRATVKDPEQVRLMYPNQRLQEVGWQEIGKRAGADLVLVGDIENFSLNRPGYIGVLQGNCRMKAALIRVKDGALVWSKTINAIWPKTGEPVAASDVDLSAFRQQLISYTSFVICRNYYNYEEKIGPPPRSY